MTWFTPTRQTVTREVYGGGTVEMELGGTGWSRRWVEAGTQRPITLQEMYGPEYVKKGFGFTPLDLLPVAVNLVPGLGEATSLLGLAGGGGTSLGVTGMSNGNGWDPWVSLYGIGVGPCGPGMKCLGASVGGICAGTCVVDTTQQQPWTELPITGYEPYGPQIGPTYQEPITGGVTPRMANGVQICCPSGYHPNRSAYFTRGIRDGGGPRWVNKGTVCVKNRRTNPLNPKALSKAGARLYQGKQVNKWLNKVEVPKRRH